MKALSGIFEAFKVFSETEVNGNNNWQNSALYSVLLLTDINLVLIFLFIGTK